MATRQKPPGPSDLSDLKARLGLGKSLEKKAEADPEPEFAPGESTSIMEAPGAFSQGGGPPLDFPNFSAPASAPRPASPPMGAPPMGGPPMAQRPPGPPGGPARRPPGPAGGPPRAQKPDAAEPAWNPPPSDPSAAADVPIKSHRSLMQLAGFAAVTALISFMALGIGYFLGDGVQQRALYDARIVDAARLLEIVKPRAEKIQTLAAAIDRSDGVAPDAELLKNFEAQDFILEPEEIAQNRLLLGPERTTLLIKYSADSKLLSQMLKRHILLTTKTDQKELEDLATQNQALNAAGFAVIFDGEGFVEAFQSKKGAFTPKKGNLVVFDSQEPFEKEKEPHLKVRYPSTGRELEIPIKNMLLLEGNEIVKSSGPNALVRYQARHKEIQLKLKEMAQYADTLTTQLDELAKKPPAPLLNISKSE